ncbi:6-phosphofructokinase [Candidatus Chlorohelix sp.]|uniref:6-phosphofructokinase n=1 Tax=Candidatus Chlorohelix sp. TaxID=3139201 RepID=UPI0030480A10
MAMPNQKRLGVLTSGGDSPGMNAAVRAVVRTAVSSGWEVLGIRRGYNGIFTRNFVKMNSRSVANIIDKGGTVLGSSRSNRFMDAAGRVDAVNILREAGIDGMIIIGGNGSLTGALELEKLGMPVVGLPASIDNDLVGTDMAIGVDTCLNTIMAALDNIRDTASSHHRAFIIEVMGRNCGYLALMASLNGGADVVITPDRTPTLEEVSQMLRQSRNFGRSHAIIIVAEGSSLKSEEIAHYLTKEIMDYYETRLTILGHVQRGGSPSAFDRIIATRLGARAVQTLLSGKSGVMCGLVHGRLCETPLSEVVGRVKETDAEIYELIRIMSH